MKALRAAPAALVVDSSPVTPDPRLDLPPGLVAADDWRLALHGRIVLLRPWTFKPRTGECVPCAAVANVRCRLRVPRDSEPGGEGAIMRSAGLALAVDWIVDEAGEFSRSEWPTYATAGELAALMSGTR